LKRADLVKVNRQSARVRGFIVAFGTDRTNDPNKLRTVTFEPGSIDTNTFEMFVGEPLQAATTPGLSVWARVPAEKVELIAVKIDSLTNTGRVTGATEIPVAAGGTTPCTGAGFVWDEELFGILKGRTVMFQIKGDFVSDVVPGAKPRAVDANFLLGTLPTGDGIAGGTFWSFFTISGA
jgi:hypothetical protein